MYLMADGLARLLAPILPVTADELWRVLPGRARGVRARGAVRRTASRPGSDEALVARYATRLEIRDLVNARLEEQRQAKVIGTSLEAPITLAGTGRFAEALARPARPTTSRRSASSATRRSWRPRRTRPADSLVVTVSRADGEKCQRCWRYVPAISTAETEGLCEPLRRRARAGRASAA